MSFDFSLLLDLVIIGLLAATIGYAVVLNRQLTQLRESRGELETLVRGFAEATARAEVGVKAMKKTAGEAGEALQATIEKGQAMRDEVQLMIETADSLATRLENAVSVSRTAGPAAAPPRPAAPSQPLRPPPLAPTAHMAASSSLGGAVMGGGSMGGGMGGGGMGGGGMGGGGMMAGASLSGGPSRPSGPGVAPPAPQRPAAAEPSLRGEAPRRPASHGDDLEPPADGPTPRENQDALSRAERELLQAIENMR